MVPPVHSLALGMILLVLAPAPAVAQEPLSPRVQELTEMCAACHGESGVPQEPTTPIIWGQREGYIYLQLRDYKRGDRKHEKMDAVVEQLERADMLALAAYFAAKPWPRNEQPEAKEDVALRAARANVAVNCTGCHQAQYQGEGTQARLAGQSREYLFTTMIETRNGVRGNNPGMTTLMRSITEADIAALADYLAGLQIR